MKTLLVLIVACTFWASASNAQATRSHDVFGRYQQLNWDQRDGLPQNTVLAIAATSDGYVWMGTYEGAARFDGVRFTVFSPSTTTGIGNSFVPALLEQRDGTFWLATYGGGLSRFSGGRFTQYTERDGLTSDFLWCLFEDRAGRLWIGTEGGGVNVFTQGRFTAYTVDQGLPSNQVRDIVDDGRGGVLAGTTRGIARIADGRVQAFEESADLAHADINKLLRAPDGSLWAATTLGQLYRVDAAGVHEFGADQGWPRDPAESMCADEEGRIWVGTNGRGLFRYSAGRFESYAPADGLPGGRVPVITHGDDRSLWIGTDGGLVRLKRPRVTVYTARDGIANEFVGSIFQDNEGNVWAETGDRLTRYANGVFKVMTAEDGLPDGRLRIVKSADGRLLVRSRAGLVRWTHDRFVKVPDPVPTPWDRVTTVLEDSSGTRWYGFRDGGMMRVRDGRATSFGVKDGLADESVHSFFEDRQGDIWVATVRNGMTRISKNGTMTSWSMKDGLAANHVKVFYEDSAGTLWIGTHGGGLSRFKNGRFANISARQGLYNDNVFQILEADGNLWMNCNTGIWRTSLSQLNEVADGTRLSVESFAYDTADGMVSSEGVGANVAGWKLHDGSLWFPTTRGIVAIDPRGRPAGTPRVAIEGISIDGAPATMEEPVRITPDQEQFDIRYTALSWNRPHAIKFRFRLMGLDRNWVDAGSRRTAFYSHLPPGSYHFAVTADDGDGVWNGTGRTLAIIVLPRFYQTWWFQAGVVSGLAALAWVSWRYRIGQIRREQAVQLAFSRELIASQERERQRIAGELHDSLGQNLLVVKNRAALGALALPDGGEARKQFDEISTTVAHTLEEVRSISHNLRPPHLDQLGLTMTIRAMIEQTAASSGVAMTADLDDVDGAFPADQEIIIYRIVQESVNNVVKHARAREVHVAVRSHEDHVDITIRDDGRGFTPAAGAGAMNGGGFGLKGLAERVQMLGGTHTIDSAPGRGTTVAVRIGTT